MGSNYLQYGDAGYPVTTPRLPVPAKGDVLATQKFRRGLIDEDYGRQNPGAVRQFDENIANIERNLRSYLPPQPPGQGEQPSAKFAEAFPETAAFIDRQHQPPPPSSGDDKTPPPPKPVTRAIRLPGGGFLFTNRDEIGGEEVVGGPAAAGREIRAIERSPDPALLNPVTASSSDSPGALVRASQDQRLRRGEDDYTARTRTVPGIEPDISGGAYSMIEGTPQQQAEINFRNTMDELAVEQAKQGLASAKMGEGGGFTYDPARGYMYSAPAFQYPTRAIENQLRLYGGQKDIDRQMQQLLARDYGAIDRDEAEELQLLRSAPEYNTADPNRVAQIESGIRAKYAKQRAAQQLATGRVNVAIKDQGVLGGG